MMRQTRKLPPLFHGPKGLGIGPGQAQDFILTFVFSRDRRKFSPDRGWIKSVFKSDRGFWHHRISGWFKGKAREPPSPRFKFMIQYFGLGLSLRLLCGNRHRF